MRLSSFVTLALAGIAACSQWSFEVSDEFLTAEHAVAEYAEAHSASIDAALAAQDAGAITKFLNDLGTSGTYEETLRLDTDLRASYKALRRTFQAYKSSGLSSHSQFQRSTCHRKGDRGEHFCQPYQSI